MGHRRSTITRRFGDALLPQRRSMTARAVTSSVNPRQRRGHAHDTDAPRTRRRWHSPALHLQRHRPAVHISSSSLPGRCPGLTENGSALRTSSSTPSAASPVVAHLRSALCGSRPDSPCVLAPLIRMGLLKIARLQRADITSPSPRAIPTQHQRRAYGASETRYCIITPFARRGSGGRMGHRRSTITRRFGDALLLQSLSMTA